jgi:hypothetical protein
VTIDLNDTHRCPLGHRCEACGTERDDLAVATTTTAFGVLCLTLCPRCERGMDVPPVSVGTAARLVAQHAGHLGIDLDQVAIEARVHPRSDRPSSPKGVLP